ncbi:membrane protein [Rhizocola hellebori]|uniref:Membrane protein n=1 Tax=Rhizocola hellebori TaxID=1392758 RepID=A0A8J3QBF9_9ACTN|nr:hypothetical protein [Rhizocola hellebori]GIH06608.1 membrane protein [Rhizocola hellebori]
MARKQPPALALAAILATAIVLIQALSVPFFAAPATHLEPRDLPVAVAGPDALVQQLSSAKPGAFEITKVADVSAADEMLRHREAYAAFIAGPDGIALHTASAASPTVAALLSQAAAQLGGGKPVPVTDVVPTDPTDPRGAGFASGFLPLALTSMLAGIALILLVRNRRARLLGLGVYAALTGLVGAAVLQSWLGVLPDNYLANATAIGLFALAAAGLVAGLGAALGRAGIGLGALLVFLIGNPLSGVAAAPELLPQPWGEVGQWLPVGAGSTLLRSAAYFDWAGGTQALWVLTGTALLGLVLVAVGRADLGEQTAEPAGPARDDARKLAETVAV